MTITTANSGDEDEIKRFGRTPPLNVYTRNESSNDSPDPKQKLNMKMDDIKLSSQTKKFPMSSKAAFKKNFSLLSKTYNTDSSSAQGDDSDTNFQHVKQQQDDSAPSHDRDAVRPFALDDNNVRPLKSPANVR